MDDKDRTIRIQQTLIDKLETEIDRAHIPGGSGSVTPSIEQVDTTNTATQTERVNLLLIFFIFKFIFNLSYYLIIQIRPLSMVGHDGATR